MTKFNENQKERLRNLNYLIASAGFLGGILGVVYSKRTGGGFWRGVGYFVLGGAVFSFPVKLVTIPFANKIIKETNPKTENNTNPVKSVNMPKPKKASIN